MAELNKDEIKLIAMFIRMSQNERQMLKNIAFDNGIKLSDFLRKLILKGLK
jgi:hypothetical protein